MFNFVNINQFCDFIFDFAIISKNCPILTSNNSYGASQRKEPSLQPLHPNRSRIELGMVAA